MNVLGLLSKSHVIELLEVWPVDLVLMH